jgi:hypothetical protein
MYIPGYEQHYYNPTTNRVPGAVLRNHFRPALEDVKVGQPGIQPLHREEDIATPWLGIHPKPVTRPIIEPITYTVAEALARRKAEAAAKKKGGA